MELFVPNREVDFDRDRIAAHFAAGTLPHGFMCRFDFSNSVAFALTFDGTGTLTKIEDATTMADLLETKE